MHHISIHLDCFVLENANSIFTFVFCFSNNS